MSQSHNEESKLEGVKNIFWKGNQQWLQISQFCRVLIPLEPGSLKVLSRICLCPLFHAPLLLHLLWGHSLVHALEVKIINFVSSDVMMTYYRLAPTF